MKPKTNRFSEGTTPIADEAPRGVPAIDVHDGAVLEDGLVVRVTLFGVEVEVGAEQVVDWRGARWRVVQLDGRYCLVST